jgi:hypothetical protein
MAKRFQFRLRTLMIVVTLLAVPLGNVGGQAKTVRERRDATLLLSKSGCNISYVGWPEFAPKNYRLKTTWIRRVIGDHEMYEISSPLGREFTNSELEVIHRVFPELKYIYRSDLSEYGKPGRQQDASILPSP